MKPTAAMIFAAGFGTRMGSLTRELPKPMVPLAGRPMIDHTIDLLEDAGISTIVANTHYLPEKIIPHLTTKGIAVSDEQPTILDTGGGLRAALPLLGNGPVLTINPDAIWRGPNPVRLLMDAWQDDMTGLLTVVESSRVFGTVKQGDFSLEHGEIRRKGTYVYGGAQIIRTDRLAEISNEAFSLNLYWDLLAKDGSLNAAVYEGDWYDIGTPAGLQLAEEALLSV